MNDAASVLDSLPFPVNLWKVQNDFYTILQNVYPSMRRAKESGDDGSAAWIASFEELGRRLHIKVL